MSTDISKVRKGLTQVTISMKQNKPVVAVMAALDGVNLLISTPLMKSERVEISQLIDNALSQISVDPLVRELFPLQLSLVPEQERELANNLRDLITALTENVQQEAHKALSEKEAKKKATFDRAVLELETNTTKALATFSTLSREYPKEAILWGNIGEALLKAKLYEEAVHYLSEALDLKPDMLAFYNIIGIALRKLEQFSTAETYFLRASKYLRNDPNLYFNIGRLYIDWQKWNKARSAALAALKLNPDFEEAKKLLSFAEKHIAKKD